MTCPDHRPRCHWANPANPLYLAYHDHEWGVPVHDDTKLFELLTLELFQAGLSWECVLNKREAFRQAFQGFNPRLVADFKQQDLERMMQNPALIRNRQKLQAAIHNARIYLDIQQECSSFNAYIWQWTHGQVIREQNKAESPLSHAIASDLKQRGMRRLGSVTLYAFLQASGIIYAHEPACFLSSQASKD